MCIFVINKKTRTLFIHKGQHANNEMIDSEKCQENQTLKYLVGKGSIATIPIFCYGSEC